MGKTVLVPTDLIAKNIDALNRSAVSTTDVDNGSLVKLGALSDNNKQKECFKAELPSSGDGLKNLWMAYSPEVVITVSGNLQAKLGDADPQNFTNIAGIPFDIYKVQVGDLVTMTKDGFSNTYTSEGYAVAQEGSGKLKFNATAIAGVTYKVLRKTNITIATGSIGSNAKEAYLLECVAVA